MDIYIYFIFYIHTPIHYIASTAGFGIHLSIYYLSGYRIGFTKDEGVTGKDDFLTRQNTTDFQLNGMVGGPKSIFKLLWLGVEHIGILNMHQKWFQSFLKVSGVPSFSLVFFSSVHPKSPDNFANRTSVFIVLPLWNVGSTPFPLWEPSRKKLRPSLSQGAASQASHFPGWGSSCTAGAGLALIIVSFFFFGGGEEIFKLKITTWNKQGWTFEKSPVDSWVFSNCIFSRFHFAPTPPAGASVEYLGWGDCNGHLDTGFPIRIISGWMMFGGKHIWGNDVKHHF